MLPDLRPAEGGGARGQHGLPVGVRVLDHTGRVLGVLNGLLRLGGGAGLVQPVYPARYANVER